jgi:hypothetical protein
LTIDLLRDATRKIIDEQKKLISKYGKNRFVEELTTQIAKRRVGCRVFVFSRFKWFIVVFWSCTL